MNNILVLTGPTGSGKTELAIAVAERLSAEIVAMDSMTLYRGMDIGTAKPDAAQRQRVPHHLLDVLDPWESASVAWWLEHACAAAGDILRRGKRVLFVGGTPLYLKALLYGLFEGPPASTAIRQRLEAEAATLGKHALHERLAGVDPVAAARLHPNDQRRVIRALEVWELTGRPISEWQTQWSGRGCESGSGRECESGSVRECESGSVRECESGSGRECESGSVRECESGSVGDLIAKDQSAGLSHLPTLPLTHSPTLSLSHSLTLSPSHVLWLDRPRAELYARINARVPRMIDAGLIDEVRALRALARPLSREASQALGYKEMFAYLDGQATLAETVRQIQTRTRNFAKRQVTWFRHLPQCQPVSEELTFQLWGT